MNNCAKYFAFALCTMFALASAYSEETSTEKNIRLLQFNQNADLIVIGEVTRVSQINPKSVKIVVEMEIERVISAIWDENELNKHIQINSVGRKQLTVLTES
jgi:hypothetical protein